jgi:hypothetical protein
VYQPKTEKDIRCPLEYGLEVFGGKWKPRIICVLAEKRVLRYSALRQEMTDIADPVLAPPCGSLWPTASCSAVSMRRSRRGWNTRSLKKAGLWCRYCRAYAAGREHITKKRARWSWPSAASATITVRALDRKGEIKNGL